MLFYFFLLSLFFSLSLARKGKVIEPNANTIWVDETNVKIKYQLAPKTKLPNRIFYILYRPRRFKRPFVVDVAFPTDKDIKRTSKNTFVSKFDLRGANIYDEQYFLAVATITEWGGLKFLAKSDKFKGYKVGAMPFIKEKNQVVRSIQAPEGGMIYDCAKIPIELAFLKESTEPIKVKVLDLNTRTSMQYTEIEVKDATALPKRDIFINPLKHRGPFMVELYLDDQLNYRSGPFGCRPKTKPKLE